MTDLGGARILIVEDSFVVADSLRTLIGAYGGNVVAMVPSAAEAVAALDGLELDAAILDIHLKGGSVEPIADRLLRDGIPFLFVTGYGDARMLPQRFQDTPRLDKPVDPDELMTALGALLASR